MTLTTRVAVLAGDGIVVRLGGTIVVVGEAARASSDLIEQLTEAIVGRVGEDRVRHLARLVLDSDNPPPLAVATFDAGAASVFLHGDIDLVWPMGRASGSDHVLGVTEAIPIEDGFGITLSGDLPSQVAGWNNLEAGSVPAGGVVVGCAVAPTSTETGRAEKMQSGGGAEATTTAADENPGDEDVDATGDLAPVDASAGARWAPPQFDAISLTEGLDLSDRAPLPIAGDDAGRSDQSDEESRPAYETTVQVIGVYSPRGFFNHPDAKYCSRTGVKMGASQTMVLVDGPRPPLGVVTLDDGATLTVQWDTVVGRDPAEHERVVQELAAPFVVADTAQSMSRSHALLELVGWDVMISDLGSRNGTYVQLVADQPRRPLASGERVALHSGTVVQLGDRSFVYHEHHVR